MAGSDSSVLATPVQMFSRKPDVLSPLFSPQSFAGCERLSDILLFYVILLCFSPLVADENMSKRQKIVKEIFESEQTYISQLNTIVKV